MVSLKDFDYELPPELIAQTPAEPRDYSRLLVLDKKTGEIEHKHFYDILDYFNKGDVIVMNNSKVFPARLIGKKEKTGGKVEVFLHRFIQDRKWQCILGGRGITEGLEIVIDKNLHCVVKKNNQDGTWELEFNLEYDEMMNAVYAVGITPLPPYIKPCNIQHATCNKKFDDRERYQTVYADDKKIGSVAAPTAGLHFTDELIDKLKKKGVQFEYVTLHVGLGTFAQVKIDDITKHKMHPEFVEISKETIARIYLAKKEGRRVIAVGTTSTRSLEAMAVMFPISNFQFPISKKFSISQFQKQFKNFNQDVDIFIYPGFEFKIVDCLITNFHLPKSTLLMLISAFASKDLINKAYRTAIEKKYRFFSYGDAMFIK